MALMYAHTTEEMYRHMIEENLDRMILLIGLLEMVIIMIFIKQFCPEKILAVILVKSFKKELLSYCIRVIRCI